tara:strand:- start:1539 stop:1949 length:411 start_codon:yes stop_codon:yes gene_type:complete
MDKTFTPYMLSQLWIEELEDSEKQGDMSFSDVYETHSDDEHEKDDENSKEDKENDYNPELNKRLSQLFKKIHERGRSQNNVLCPVSSPRPKPKPKQSTLFKETCIQDYLDSILNTRASSCNTTTIKFILRSNGIWI